jgi:hypothetical protein
VLRILHVLLIASVMLCGMHVAQPAWAHDEAAHHQVDSDIDKDSGHEGSADPAHLAHHHCPAALHQDAGPLHDRARNRPLLFAAHAPPLGSLSQAPPLEPPAA